MLLVDQPLESRRRDRLWISLPNLLNPWPDHRVVGDACLQDGIGNGDPHIAVHGLNVLQDDKILQSGQVLDKHACFPWRVHATHF